MRQRVKRRLFMMSMALAAGAAGPAYAKGGGKAEEGLEAYAREGVGPYIAAQPHSGTQAPDKGWRLELLPPETKAHFDRDTSPRENKRFGLALRMAF